MYNLILGLYLLVAIFMITIILFQKSAGIAMHVKNNFGGPRARSNPLAKLTCILGFVFMGLCLYLTRINIAADKNNKIAEQQLASDDEQTRIISTDALSNSAPIEENI